MILSEQIDGDVLTRYRTEKWSVLTGIIGESDPLTSTYDFMRDVIGYDLAEFFHRSSSIFRKELDVVLNTLLIPEPT